MFARRGPQSAGLLFAIFFRLAQIGDSQGTNTSISLSSYPPLPILPLLVAPTNLNATLRPNGGYGLKLGGTYTLVQDSSVNYSLSANSTLLLTGFTWVSCVAMQLAATDRMAYAFVTTARAVEVIRNNSANDVIRDYTLNSTSNASDSYYASLIPTNATITARLMLGQSATTSSGAVSATVSLTSVVTIVIVNPSNNSVSVKLDVSLNPLGGCQDCNKARTSGNLLDNCNQTSTTVQINGTSTPAASYSNMLQPIQSGRRYIEQGKSAVLAAFTNAACMMYTLKAPYAPSDFSQNKPLVSGWVANSTQQTLIANAGSATDAQRSTLSCSYPATTDLRRPCFSYSQALDPSDTYYIWVQNINGPLLSYLGNLTVDFELMILKDPNDCNQGRLFNLSANAASLNAQSTPLPYTQPSYSLQRSSFDPGVTPFTFAAATGNQGFNYPITMVGGNGSLSQVGYWSIDLGDSLNPLQATTQVTIGDLVNFSLDANQARVQFAAGGTFSNAACFSEYLTASSPVTSYLIARSVFQSYYNSSAALPLLTGLSPKAYDLAVTDNRQFQQQNVNATISGLSPTETYSFVVTGPKQNSTNISTQTVAYPSGSPVCRRGASAPSPAAAQAGITSGSVAVRGVFDRPITQISGDGGSDCAGAIIGAACIAFTISARGLATGGTGPTLYSQYYNVSSPGNSTDPNFSASAILLEGAALNLQFVRGGFPNSTITNASTSANLSTTPITIKAGCLVNYTNPGPCVAYADNLSSFEVYYLWGVLGAASPSSWLLISFEARPSGSCSQVYPTPPKVQAAPTPAAMRPASADGTNSASSGSSTSTGLIVGVAVAGVVAIAAAILLLLWVRRRRRKKGGLRSSSAQASASLSVDVHVSGPISPWEPPDSQYAYINDFIGREDGSKPPSSISSPFEISGNETSDRSRSRSRSASVRSSPQNSSRRGSGLLGRRLGPAEIVANIAAAADSQSRPEPGLRASTSGASSSRRGAALLSSEYADQWEIDLSRLKLKVDDEGEPVLLGEGGFGAVYHGVLGVREVAVKIANRKSRAQHDKFLREIMVLKRCRDPSIVQFLGASVGEEIVLVMEFMRGGDLYRAISRDVDGLYRWKRRGAKLAVDIIEGLCLLHGMDIVHLDLKSPNILLSEDGRQAKISDVGLAKLTTETGTVASQGISFAWAPTEQILGGKCTFASDMYSFGVVLWEICTGEPPRRTRDYRDLQVPEECPRPVADLVSRCFDPEPPLRPTAQEAHRVLTRCLRSLSRESLP